MTTFAIIVFILFLIYLFIPSSSIIHGTVLQVIDGDTILIKTNGDIKKN